MENIGFIAEKHVINGNIKVIYDSLKIKGEERYCSANDYRDEPLEIGALEFYHIKSMTGNIMTTARNAVSW